MPQSQTVVHARVPTDPFAEAVVNVGFGANGDMPRRHLRGALHRVLGTVVVLVVVVGVALSWATFGQGGGWAAGTAGLSNYAAPQRSVRVDVLSMSEAIQLRWLRPAEAEAETRSDSTPVGRPVGLADGPGTEEATGGREPVDAIASAPVDPNEVPYWGGWTQRKINELKLGFRMLPPVSLTRAALNPEACQGRQASSLPRLSSAAKVLVVIGAEKAGTTWLWNVLSRRADYVTATGRMAGGWSNNKEVHYFDYEALTNETAYADLFPLAASRPQEGDKNATRRALLDVTPAYFVHPLAPARLQEVAPHARIVALLRDPVARAYSQYRMGISLCKTLKWPGCGHRSLAQVVAEDFLALPRGCRFDAPTAPEEQRTHYECNACLNTNPSAPPKCAEETGLTPPGCLNHTRIKVHSQSMTAAMLGWWLAFFPPEQMLLVTSNELQDANLATKALNRILAHSGLKDAKPFVPNEFESIKGYIGMKTNLTMSTARSLQQMRSAMSTCVRDTQVILDTFFPEQNVTVPFESYL